MKIAAQQIMFGVLMNYVHPSFPKLTLIFDFKHKISVILNPGFRVPETPQHFRA